MAWPIQQPVVRYRPATHTSASFIPKISILSLRGQIFHSRIENKERNNKRLKVSDWQSIGIIKYSNETDVKLYPVPKNDICGSEKQHLLNDWSVWLFWYVNYDLRHVWLVLTQTWQTFTIITMETLTVISLRRNNQKWTETNGIYKVPRH